MFRQTSIRLYRQFRIFLACLLLSGMLSGCGDEDSNVAPQRWGTVDVHVETRPDPLRIGMNEFLIVANSGKGSPVYDLIISLRTNDQDPWVQAIQDGQMGVYRRAAKVDPDTRAVLQVKLERRGDSGILYFPLKVDR